MCKVPKVPAYNPIECVFIGGPLDGATITLPRPSELNRIELKYDCRLPLMPPGKVAPLFCRGTVIGYQSPGKFRDKDWNHIVDNNLPFPLLFDAGI
jgi:hypothetical protein